MPPSISVCIPAYNRPQVLPELLDSILAQDFSDYNVIICEDDSPKREAIRQVAQTYARSGLRQIRYLENEKNLGYDANLRNLIEKADGDYCFFMGNDDLMCPGALRTVVSAIRRYENVGVVLRSYASFDRTPERIDQVFRYFEKETFFPSGPATVATFFRRSVVIPGMVVNRRAADALRTDLFDGTLLYQLYLVANILIEMNGISLPEILVLYRNGGIPDFGNSENERGKFVPREQTPESSLHFMRGMLRIASSVERNRGVPIYGSILKDISNYSYPILSIQAQRSLPAFIKYALGLSRMGFWRSGMFFLYFFGLLFFGKTRIDRFIRVGKKWIGHTPSLGAIYKGESQ